MLKILNQQKGFKVDFKQRKQLTPLQKKCMDIVLDTQKLMEEAMKNDEMNAMENVLFQIVALQTMLPAAMKSNNESVIKMQLRSLSEFVNKIEFELIPKAFLKEFMIYRKRIIERIGRL